MTDIARGLRAAAMAAAVLVAGCTVPPAAPPGTMLGYGTPGVSGYVPAGEASDLKSLMAWCSQVSIGAAPPTLSGVVDASLLLLPLVGFLPTTDSRMLGTVAVLQERLSVNGLLLRYDTSAGHDGLPPGEGGFLACTFWLADNLLLQGRRTEAEAIFERLLGQRNDVGLLAEDYDPHAGRMLGNFPHAFSQVALVNTALNLTQQAGPAEHRSTAAPSAVADAA